MPMPRPRCRQVFPLEKLEQLTLRRAHLRLQGGPSVRFEGGATVRREGLRHAAEGGQQRRRGGRLLDLRAHVGDRAFDRATWLREARADAPTHVLGLAGVVGWNGLEARDPGRGGGFVVERGVEGGVISRRVEAIAADERNALLVERQAGQRIVHAVDQQVAVQGIVGDQAGRRDRLQPLLELEQRRLAGRDGLRRIVRPAPGGSDVAALGSAHWVLRPAERIEVTHERCHVVGPSRGGWLKGHQQPQECQEQDSMHAPSGERRTSAGRRRAWRLQ